MARTSLKPAHPTLFASSEARPNPTAPILTLLNATNSTGTSDIRGGDMDPALSRLPLSISCDDCSMRDTNACADCVVSFLLPNDRVSTVESDSRPVRFVRRVALAENELATLAMLQGAGLAPRLRHSEQAC